jgi:hypothetical protein
VAVKRRHHGEGKALERLDGGVEGVGHQLLGRLLELPALEVAQVIARREDPAGAGEDQATGVESGDGLGQRVEDLVVQRAAPALVGDPQAGDPVGRLVEQQLARRQLGAQESTTGIWASTSDTDSSSTGSRRATIARTRNGGAVAG